MLESAHCKLARSRMLQFSPSLFFALIFASVLVLWPLTTYAATITVDGTTCSLPNAIQSANTDGAVGGCTTGSGSDTLVLTAATYSLASGTYSHDGSTATPSIVSSIIISGAIDGVTIDRTGGTQYRLFHVGTAGNLTLRGITVRHGDSGTNYGGAIYNRGQVTLIDSNLLNNVAKRGGGLYNTGTVTFTNALLFSNRATEHGGGLFNNSDGKTATLISSEVISNSASSNGGGIYNNNGGSTVTLTNTQVLSNAAGSGGGIYVNNTSSKVLLTNSAVNTNRATSNGGGMYLNQTGIAVLTSTQILSNTSNSSGGGIYLNNNGSKATLTDSAVNANRTNSTGGGIYINSASSAVLTNTEVISNFAKSNGGGFYLNNGSNLSVAGSEVIRNRANSQGGAFYAVSDGAFAITNTQVLTNSAGLQGGGFYLGSGSSTIMTATLINGNVSGSDGGGIFSMLNANTTIVLTNGEVFSNSATLTGGGIVNGNKATLTNSPVISNRAGDDGGGIYAFFSGSTTLINSDLMLNRSGGDGGAINSANTTTLTDSDVLSNTAQGQGGGIYIGTGNNNGVTLNNADVIANYAVQDGGGIASFSLTKLNDSAVISNTSLGSGGGIYVASENSASAKLTNSDVVSNTATTNGGGIFSGDDGSFTNSNVLSNTAGGDGGGIYSDGPATFSNTKIAANVAGSRGGGLYNSSSSTANLTDSDIISNSAGSAGGGFYINTASSATMLNSDVLSNTTSGRGGGLFNNANSNLTLTNLEIRANTSVTNGGGLLNNGIATITRVDIISNTALASGGGVYNNNTAIITGTQVISNSAALFGGGIYITLNGSGYVTNTDVIANHAGIDGGGILNNKTAIISNTQVLSNTALRSGGGIKNSGALTLTQAYLLGNQATLSGAGFYQDMGQANITQARIVENVAGDSGGALQFDLGSATINQSCIVANSDLALNYLGNSTIDAQHNWWGASDGPSGAGLGAGDSITNSVTYIPFETSALFDCTSRSIDIDFSKSVSPSVDLLPGQPVTFTLVITNNDTLSAQNLRVVDALPAAFQLSEVISTSTTISEEGGSFRMPSLGNGESAILYLRGTISTTLNADLSITNTATVSNSLSGVLTATTAANIQVPRLSWSQASYVAAEDSGLYTATVVISPANPYAATTAQATITAPVTITLAAGASSAPVGVPIVDDAIVLSRTIPLSLLSALGAAIDDQGGAQATLILIEDDAAPALTVEKRANATLAFVGETITYTYRITNTGNITLAAVSAVDDRLGTLPGLSGQLGILETRAVTHTYIVQAGDLPGPLVNTVTVSGTDIFGNNASDEKTVSVSLATQTIQLTKHAAPVGDLMPGQPLTYTLRVTNTDPATLNALYITDPLPAHFVLGSINTTGPAISVQGDRYVIPQLLGSQVATIAFVGAVDASPTSDLTLTNSATLTNALIGTLSASVSNQVIVPRVNWSETDYSADETSGTFMATLLLSPTNPYGSASVNVITTDSHAAAFQAEAVQTITFPPNSGSQQVVVDIVNDSAVLSRTITLQLQTLSGAALGAGISGTFASIHIVEDDAVPVIEVSATVTPTQAMVGDTVTYTYRITNTGNVTFATISALTAQVGTIDDLAGELAPNATRTAIVTYVVQQSDLPGPLVSTLEVTATDIFATAVTGDASTTVSVSAPTALPGTDQPEVPEQSIRIFLPSLQGN